MLLFQHVYALQQLEEHLKEGACALDVGSGSGYLTAAMAYMVTSYYCVVAENIHTSPLPPQQRYEIPGVGGGGPKDQNF